MITLFGVITWAVIFILFGIIYWYATIPQNLPPGPTGLPLLGSSLDYINGSSQHLVLLKNIEKYGPLFKIYIANKLVVVLGDYNTIQEAIVNQGDVFIGRCSMRGALPKKCCGHGVITTEGDLWKEQRRFALSTLRDFGVGRPILEPRIKEEIEFLIEKISEYGSSGKSFDPFIVIGCAVANVISFLIFGHRFGYDDEEFVRQFTALNERASGGGVGFLSPFILSETCFSMMRVLPVVGKLAVESESFYQFVEHHAEKVASEFDPDAEPCNYIHAFLRAAKNNQGKYFTNDQMLSTAFELYAAGSETTSTTLRWAILFLARDEETQEKMHREIRDQVGLSHLPAYADRVKLPFTEAVVTETQRLANLLPLGVLRRTIAPTKLMGYDIPEDCLVVPFLTNVLHNPKLYQDPHRFDPYRFFSDGKLIRDPTLIPFQAGKRVCLGEPLARMELFLILTGLISRFRFYFPSDKPIPTTEPVVGLTCTPVRYQICVETRN